MAPLTRDTSAGLRMIANAPAHTGLPWRWALLIGTLAVGILDILDAFVFFGMRGAPPIRILQSIAAGVLGRSSFRGGWATAALGLALHFFIAFVVVLVFMAASRRLGLLTRHPVAAGLVYGVAVYLVMTFVVVPASAAGGGGPPAWAVAVNGVLIHMFGVGLPASLAARAAARAR
jgi:hypothetical protein